MPGCREQWKQAKSDFLSANVTQTNIGNHVHSTIATKGVRNWNEQGEPVPDSHVYFVCFPKCMSLV